MPNDQAEEAGDKRAQEVDRLRQDQAHQAVPRCACGQDALHHRLVAHLVESECSEDGNHHSQERRHRMARRLAKVHAFRHAGRLGPLDHRSPAAGNLMQCTKEQGDAARHQEDALEEIGPHHRRQSAVDRVRPHAHRNQHQHENGLPPQHVFTEHGVRKRQTAGVQDHRHVDEHVQEQQQAGIRRADRRPKTVGEEAGNGRHLVPQVNRYEEQEHERVGGQAEPLPVGYAHAVVVGNAHGADHLLAGDAGGDEGRADQPPRHAVAAEKVAVGGVRFLPSRRDANPHDKCHRSKYDHHVDRRKHACDPVAECRRVWFSSLTI